MTVIYYLHSSQELCRGGLCIAILQMWTLRLRQMKGVPKVRQTTQGRAGGPRAPFRLQAPLFRAPRGLLCKHSGRSERGAQGETETGWTSGCAVYQPRV